MTFTITTSSKVLKSNETENLEILTDTTGGGSEETALSIDYTLYYSRIATALETIATNSTTIANNSTTIATNSTTIAEKLTAIESHQKKIKELGEGVGYRIKSPYEIFSMVTVYKLLIEEGKILDLDGDGSRVQESLAKVVEYMQKISQNIPKEF